MSHRFSPSPWSRFLTLLLVVVIALVSSLQPGPKATAQEGATATPTATPDVPLATTATPIGTLEVIDETKVVDASPFIVPLDTNIPEGWTELILHEDQAPVYPRNWWRDGINPYTGWFRYVHPIGTQVDYTMEGYGPALPTETTSLLLVIAVKPEYYGASSGANNLMVWLQNPSDPSAVVGYRVATSQWPTAGQWSYLQITVGPEYLVHLMGGPISIRVVAYERESIVTVFGVDHWGLYYMTPGTSTPVPPTATPSPTPTATRTPTPTWTPSPCPTLPPLPTPTATPTVDPGAVGQVVPGDTTCRHSTNLPIGGVGSRDFCPIYRAPSPEEVESSEVLQQWPACFPLDPQIASAMLEACGGSFRVEWQVSDGREIIGKKITCTGHQETPEDTAPIFMVAVPAGVALGPFLAALAPAVVVIGAGILVGGVVYVVLSYDGPPAENWTFVEGVTEADEWVLGQTSPPTGMWPRTPFGVRNNATVNVKAYEWSGSQPQTVYAIQAASRPHPAGNEKALVQVMMPGDKLTSWLLVPDIRASDDVVKGPIILTDPVLILNELANQHDANPLFSTKHGEFERIRAVVEEPGGIVRARGDGQSSGSVQLWAGVKCATPTSNVCNATVGGVQISGSVVSYIAFIMPVQRTNPTGTLKQLGNAPWYYSREQVQWKCAWHMSNYIGHRTPLQSEILPFAQGYAKWLSIKAEYGLTIPILILYLPT